VLVEGTAAGASALAPAAAAMAQMAAVWAAVAAALLASAARQEISGVGAPRAQQPEAGPQESRREQAAPTAITRPGVRDSTCIAQLAQILFSDRFCSVIQLVPHASSAVSHDPSVPVAGSEQMATWLT